MQDCCFRYGFSLSLSLFLPFFFYYLWNVYRFRSFQVPRRLQFFKSTYPKLGISFDETNKKIETSKKVKGTWKKRKIVNHKYACLLFCNSRWKFHTSIVVGRQDLNSSEFLFSFAFSLAWFPHRESRIHHFWKPGLNLVGIFHSNFLYPNLNLT